MAPEEDDSDAKSKEEISGGLICCDPPEMHCGISTTPEIPQCIAKDK